ncbi:lysosomal alpha-glucosidase-like [Plutella xylostella]|uniref:lysosomal alpha-glucosidase-like n=1 Tax=Plutella xylostella TaxID=51655 RepID=UPI002032A810|nr:lysosomal alpha-glucosidase-like [Plutella xylostella]
MPKIPYKPDKTGDDDEDYEIVSFEDFCDKSPGSKTDLLTLNDNINYRLCYESDKGSKAEDEGEPSGKDAQELRETSLGGGKNVSWKRRGSSSFAPFGRHNATNNKGSLFSGVVPKPKNEGESSREHRYQRFSAQATFYQRLVEFWQQCGSTLILMALVGVLCVAVWVGVVSLVGAGGDQHYRKLWERAHHADLLAAAAAATTEKPTPEHHYHDHNNLSTKNKLNITDKYRKKPELNKKSYMERPLATLNGLCSKVTMDRRFDCFPQDGASEEGCIKRGCCWNATTTKYGSLGKPYCFYPPDYDTFHFVNMSETRHGISVCLERMRPSGYPGDFDLVNMDFKYLSNGALQIKIYDAENKRFVPPYPEIPLVTGPINNLKYRVVVESATVGFKVIRNDDNVTILDSQNVGGMILSDKFLQMSTLLPTNKIYGIGERQGPLRVDMNWQVYTIFNSDSVPVENTPLYGSHPFHLGLEDSGKSHGMVLLNSNAMDIVTQPTPALTYRTIGGILNFLLVLGDAPNEVLAEYTALVGRPAMPPYWALGFHLCKFNYGSLNVTRDVWQKNRDAGLPFDVQWNDLDYMSNSNDFTYDTARFAGLPQFVRALHRQHMHYVVLIDPGISSSEKPGEYPPFDRGLELDIFIKNSSNMPFVGKVWNKQTTVWPDFTHPSAQAYWLEMLKSLHDQVPFDGAWIDMNEPSNFLSGPMYGHCEPEDLPYVPHGIRGDGLKTKTLCMDAKHYAGSHYDWHNLYSITESIATNFAMTELRGSRPFIISRSTFVGSGRHAGHWSGDVASAWHDMRMSIPEMLAFSLFGVPLMGADICGFRGNTTVELCTRWMQLGAFYPFSRNHNSDTSIPQDPASLGPVVLEASIRILRVRYSLLPLYYTLFWRAKDSGATVARPLFAEFPTDPLTHDIDTQFMIGPSIMIAPILQPNTTSTQAYLPGDLPWLVLTTEKKVPNKYATIHEHGTVLVRPGSIVPLQTPSPRVPVSTYTTRSEPLQLAVLEDSSGKAYGELYWDDGDSLISGPVSTYTTRSEPLQLIVLEDSTGKAYGELYWDDGDSLNSYEEKKYSHIEFYKQSTSVNSAVQWWGYGVPTVNNITIYSIEYPVKAVELNDQPCKKPLCEFSYDAKDHILRVYNMNLSLDKPFSLTWTNKNSYPKLIVPNGGGHLAMVNETVVDCRYADCTEIKKR